MFIGFGVEIALGRVPSKCLNRETGEQGTAAHIAKLAQELQRPFLPRIVIFVAVCTTMAAVMTASLVHTLWPLLGLLFPVGLVATVAITTLANKYAAAKRAFVSCLSAEDRKIFVDTIEKSGHSTLRRDSE